MSVIGKLGWRNLFSIYQKWQHSKFDNAVRDWSECVWFRRSL